MSITNPITKDVALSYLLGFHCSGARISEPQNDIPVRMNTKTDVEYTADPDSIFGEQNGADYYGLGDTDSKIIGSDNNYTTEYKGANTSYTFEDNSIGEAACQLALRIIGYSTGDTYQTRHDVYSADSPNKAPDGEYKSRNSWPTPVALDDFNYPNFYFGFDCSSFVSFIYRIVFGNNDIGNAYASYNYTSHKWGLPCNTESLAVHAVENNLIVNLNCFNPKSLLPGDILLYWKKGSDHKYQAGHAALFLGYYKYHPITGAEVDTYLLIETNSKYHPLHVCGINKRTGTSGDIAAYHRDGQFACPISGSTDWGIRMIFRPSIEYFKKIEGLDCSGLILTSREITETSKSIETTADDINQSIKIPT